MKEKDKEDAPKKVRPSVLAEVMAKLKANMERARLRTLRSLAEDVSNDTRAATSIRDDTFVYCGKILLRKSQPSRRYKLASMKFKIFARCLFLRSPRSYRVAEKSSQIGSREPNCAVFQQNPTVVTAELDTPMDSDAINSQA